MFFFVSMDSLLVTDFSHRKNSVNIVTRMVPARVTGLVTSHYDPDWTEFESVSANKNSYFVVRFNTHRKMNKNSFNHQLKSEQDLSYGSSAFSAHPCWTESST
jgi:hypothetical protein